MEIELLVIGSTKGKHLQVGIDEYQKKINKYLKYNINTLKVKKYQKKEEILSAECDQILNYISEGDYLILLDEKGSQYTSQAFAGQLQALFNKGMKKIVFVIGGAFGFEDKVYERSNMQISLSSLTFNYDMVRLIFTEQLYRALTILSGHPYHND